LTLFAADSVTVIMGASFASDL